METLSKKITLFFSNLKLFVAHEKKSQNLINLGPAFIPHYGVHGKGVQQFEYKLKPQRCHFSKSPLL
jgi:hypothetical protein